MTETVTDEGSALGHSFTNYKSNHDATLTQDGTKTAVCDRCDAEDTKTDEGTAYLKYVVENDTVTITECQKTFFGAMTIPDTIDGCPVVSIGGNAFSNCPGLMSVIIPDCVTSIGENAFSDCSDLTSVTIGSGVTIIGKSAFSNCKWLTEINYNAVNVADFSASDKVFSNAGKRDTGITVTFGDLVQRIPTNLFNDSSLFLLSSSANIKTVIVGKNIASVGSSAFSGCIDLKQVHISDLAAWCGVSFSNAYSNPLYYADELYVNDELTTDLVIPAGVTSIRSYAFNGFTRLKSVIIPDSVTSIGENAFSDCSDLTSVTIGSDVTSVSDSAFDRCRNLVIRCVKDSYAYNYCVEKEIFYSYDIDISDYVPADYTVYNNHTYELFSSATSWLEARAICEAKGGHLVTVTSEGENAILKSLRDNGGTDLGYWLGGTDKITEGTWKWVTDEPFNYSNWSSGEPNNENDEDYLELLEGVNWNDSNNTASLVHGLHGFICEYDDVRIPYDTSKKVLINYGATTYARFDFAVSWDEAKTACEKMGGHLATVTTADEESVISSLCNGNSMGGYWLGGTDEEAEGTWKWITGEKWSYTAWGSSQPDNSGGKENYLEYYNVTCGWNDNAKSYGDRGFICEFDANYVPVKSVIYNNHLYSLYNESLSWADAEAMCVRAGGHLVSITSAEEQAIINDLIGNQFKGLYWIGAKKNNGLWTWSSSEEFNYSNWATGESNTENEPYAQILSCTYQSKTSGQWIDNWNNNTVNIESLYYFYNISNSGFICEIDLSQYTAYKGITYNNNYYEVYSQDAFWTEASKYAESRGGHLISIADENENAIATQLSKTVNSVGCWYGGSDFGHEGIWNWVDDAPFTFDDWRSGEPNNSNLTEHFNHYYTGEGGGWNDAVNNSADMCFIVEYDNAAGTKNGISWSYDGNTLTLSGSGDLTHIDQLTDTPWFEHIRDIQFDGEFDIIITPFKNTEWYSDFENGPVVVDGYLLDYKGIMPADAELVINDVKVVAPYAFDGQVNLRNVEFGETLERVCGNAFSGCAALTAVELSTNVTAVAENAFTGCSDVTVKGYYNETVKAYALAHSFIYEPYTATITLDPTEGQIENNTVTVIAKKAIGDIVFPEAESGEYAFGGWYIDENCTIQVTAKTVFDTDATVYASWLEVSSVVIKSMPDSLQYVVGESLDTTGLVLTATYPTGETRDFADGFTFTPSKFTKQGKYRVKVDFKGKFAYFYVEVKATENVTISVETLPGKLNYETGEKIDPTGLTLLLDYGNGITKTIRKGFTFDYDFSTVGTKAVTVHYTVGEATLSTQINVEVTEADYVIYSDSVVCDGNTFAVPVKIKGNKGVKGFSLNFSYDPDMIRPVSISADSSLNGILTDNIGEDIGTFNVNWNGNKTYIDNGTLFNITFESVASKKSETNIDISFDRSETFDGGYSDISLICRPVNVKIIVPAVLLFYAEPIEVSSGSSFEIPVFVSNPLDLSEADLTISYDKSAFSVESVFSDYGTTSVTNADNLKVIWNGNIDEDGVLFTVKLTAASTAVGQYDFAVTCNNAVFDDAGSVMCRDFSVNVQNQYAADIYLEGGYLVPGESIDVSIMIDNNPGVMGFSLTLKYDPDTLTLSDVSQTELITSMFDYSDDNGTLKIVWANTGDITENGELFKLTFLCVNADKPSSELSLSYDIKDTFDSHWNDVVFDCKGTKLVRVYTAKFYIEDTVVSTQNYSVDTECLDEPEIPAKPYQFARWQSYDLSVGGDLEIHAVYDLPKIISFAQKTLHVGESYRIITSGNFDATGYVWKSDNTSVATVDSRGVVTAVGIGTATITVTRYGEDSFGNEVSAVTTIDIKVTKEKDEYKSFGERLKAFIERLFSEIIFDILENLKRMGIVFAYHKN
ncbi:MAG: leucine-rich repeat protein [Clostridiales bacterium]|nr:leucine-rich repeat protein [Clostridiales bacterium]